MKKLLKLYNTWNPHSWKDYPIKQHPNWPNKELKKVINSLRAFPALVPIHEIITLKDQFKNVSNKKK